MLAQLQTLSKRQYLSSYFLAVIHLGLGDRDRAFELLDKAREERSGFLAFINVEPMMDELRSDNRFADLLGRLGLASS
jgi:serine/threonine-protein kinase